MFNELQEKIVGLEGVISCKLTGEEQRLDEIHIIASKNRDPKKIVRDIETMVLVTIGKEIDHKKISIAQVKNPAEAIIENRIEIISIYRENNRNICHFKLTINDNLIEKEVESNYEEDLSITIARGIVEIIVQYTMFQGKVRVENVFVTGINNEIVIVQLVLAESEKMTNPERLIGAAYINNELPLATGKACLKALNRRLNLA
ncbi:MAG: hypothetical protein MI740_00075 [Halanaerobiales bacterium]|nr:hypothetical protein [Halanaerobiales bacterium]